MSRGRRCGRPWHVTTRWRGRQPFFWIGEVQVGSGLGPLGGPEPFFPIDTAELLKVGLRCVA